MAGYIGPDGHKPVEATVESAPPFADIISDSILVAISTLGAREITELLDVLANQAREIPNATRLLVAHNSPSASDSLRRSVEARGAEYLLVERLGYASARNAVLDALAPNESLIFIDDDEVPNPGWLRSHLRCLHMWQADVTFGPVVTVVPATAPAWLDGGAVLRQVPSRPSGPTDSHVYSGNTAIRATFMRTHHLRFDESYNASGSEDTEFFLRCRRRGARVVWCESAGVLERADAERMTLAGMARRTFRRGKTSTSLRIERLQERRRPILTRKLMQIAWGSLQIMVGQLASRSALKGRGVRDLALAVGGIAAIVDSVKCPVSELTDHDRSIRSRNRLWAFRKPR